MKPEWDLREFAGVVEKEKAKFDPEKYPVEVYMVKGQSLENAKMIDSMGIKMMSIPERNFKMLYTEVTQKFYTSIMGSNPSHFKGDLNPVERVSWYDAIYFCNKLSEKLGYTPVYAVDGETDVAKWNYTPHKEEKLYGEITQNVSASGFRLPTVEEWQYAARGGRDYEYSGSDNLDEVGWYWKNSNKKTHEVAKKKPNGYGLYDMIGNVCEWCWDSIRYDFNRFFCGGSWHDDASICEVGIRHGSDASFQRSYWGLRIVCSVK